MALLTEPFGGPQGYGTWTLVILFVFCVISVLAFFYINRSFDSAAVALKNRYFKVSGALLFMGTILFVLSILLILFAFNAGFYVEYAALLAMLIGAVFSLLSFVGAFFAIRKVNNSYIGIIYYYYLYCCYILLWKRA